MRLLKVFIYQKSKWSNVHCTKDILPCIHSIRNISSRTSAFSIRTDEFINQPHHFIGGRRIDPDSSEYLNLTEPSTGKCHGKTKQANKQTIESAVQCSSTAFPEWSKQSPLERGKVLLNAARILKTRVNEISELEVFNNGKPIWEARFDISGCIDSLEYFGGIAASVTGEFVNLPNDSFGYTIRQPLGVVASIGAWNYPFSIAVWKSAPAIASGNCVVFKPSEFTPMSVMMLADIYKEAGLPDGVFNVVQGDGKVGQMLCEHPEISKISLTGSVPVGIKILQSCAKDMKHVTLELGGKSPLIIFDDCDFENAIKGTIVANFMTQGQVCSNGTRVYVHENIWDKFVHELVEKSETLKVGDPMDEETRVGATIHEQHFRDVAAYIREAEMKGAKVLCGGKKVNLPGHLSGGYYMSPCILSEVADDMRVAREEVFGPVLCLFKFSSEDEVIKRSNDSPFGLAAGIFTKDLKRAHRVASRLEAGIVWINNYNVTPCELPFGGVKMSGIGRENGRYVFDYYTNVKSVYVEMGDVEYPLL